MVQHQAGLVLLGQTRREVDVQGLLGEPAHFLAEIDRAEADERVVTVEREHRVVEQLGVGIVLGLTKRLNIALEIPPTERVVHQCVAVARDDHQILRHGILGDAILSDGVTN